MNQAIKLNPSFSTAFFDRGITNYDKHDYDSTIASADPLIKTKPSYAVSFNERGSSYENRREGDRIIQEANLPIRNNQYNAYAYSADTFPLVSPAMVAPAPAPALEPTPAAKQAPAAAAADQDSVPMPQPNPARTKPVQHRPPQRQVMNGRQPIR